MLEFKYEAYKETKAIYTNELDIGKYSGTIQSAGFFTSARTGTNMYSIDILLDDGRTVKHSTSLQYLRSMQRIIQDLVPTDDSARVQTVFSGICETVFKRKEKKQYIDLTKDFEAMVARGQIHAATKVLLDANIKGWCESLQDQAIVAKIATEIVANQALLFKMEDLARLSETGELAGMAIPITFSMESYVDKKGESKRQMRQERIHKPAIAPTEVAAAHGDDEIPF